MPRPIAYDTEQVLESALVQFWEEGFKRSSVDAIVAATALNKHSLYQSFGGKNGLFLQVLARYRDQYGQRCLDILDRNHGLAALRDYFNQVLGRVEHRGCLLINTAIELGNADPDCQRLLTDYYDRIATAFARALRQGQAEGSVRAGLDPDATARWLLRTLQGLSVGARLGQNDGAVDDLLALLKP